MSFNLGTATPSIDSNSTIEHFTKPNHPSYIISKFLSYLQQGFLCDVIFICDNGKIKRRIIAHRLIVSILSDYFRSLFENHKQTEIIFNDIDPDVFEKIILYAYEGRLEIHSTDVTKILDMAHIFHIIEIIEACCNFIKTQVQPSNCFSLYRLALKHNLQDLTQNIWNYILNHFSIVIQNNHEFLKLSFDEMERLLASDDINVQSEEIVYEAFISWLDYDLNRHNDHLEELFSLIRLPLIKRKYLTDYIDTNERFENNSLCQILIIEAMRYHLAPEKRLTMKTIRTTPRKSTLGAFYCFGGIDNTKNPQTIERYDFRTDCWQIDGHWNSRRSQFACIRLNKKLYICGGRDGLKTLNSIEIYDFQTKVWTIGSPMLTNRYDLGIGHIGGPLYTIGGHDGRVILNTVERFDPETSEWTYVASMNNARYTLGVAVLENRIYAVGGKDSSTSLREIEFFDPHTNRWSQCASMIKCRASVAVVSCNELLYAIGGYEFLTTNKNIIRHDDGERYDPKCNQWTLITSFSRPKEGLGIAVVNNELYIVGGFDGKFLNEMEKYNTETNKWKKCSPLGTKRAGACLIHLPNSINQSLNIPMLSQGNKNSSTGSHQMNRLILS
ncbi:unnamed protein product [Rotaria sp. Silwood2]|nr:unnamed protein product [Rotaria sp. Silwood2]CAF2542836.1 unnamed protein product [Rotaria sp. Silwood2]CAF2779272.1 unnamed protein product [Rotaria sp. Silwood2]CAF4014449.1 unnamed protein product [Rotaria sp. Silwood2]CAF4130761.1 unnamed protein product [Rotaria sp. Silwood2]